MVISIFIVDIKQRHGKRYCTQGKYMRVAVISDIHGNQIAFDAVLQDLAQQPEVDQLVIAGDLCLNGPCPRQVMEMVQGLGCPVIQGNVDSEVVNEARSEERRV